MSMTRNEAEKWSKSLGKDRAVQAMENAEDNDTILDYGNNSQFDQSDIYLDAAHDYLATTINADDEDRLAWWSQHLYDLAEDEYDGVLSFNGYEYNDERDGWVKA